LKGVEVWDELEWIDGDESTAGVGIDLFGKESFTQRINSDNCDSTSISTPRSMMTISDKAPRSCTVMDEEKQDEEPQHKTEAPWGHA